MTGTSAAGRTVQAIGRYYSGQILLYQTQLVHTAYLYNFRFFKDFNSTSSAESDFLLSLPDGPEWIYRHFHKHWVKRITAIISNMTWSILRHKLKQELNSQTFCSNVPWTGKMSIWCHRLTSRCPSFPCPISINKITGYVVHWFNLILCGGINIPPDRVPLIGLQSMVSSNSFHCVLL